MLIKLSTLCDGRFRCNSYRLMRPLNILHSDGCGQKVSMQFNHVYAFLRNIKFLHYDLLTNCDALHFLILFAVCWMEMTKIILIFEEPHWGTHYIWIHLTKQAFVTAFKEIFIKCFEIVMSRYWSRYMSKNSDIFTLVYQSYHIETFGRTSPTVGFLIRMFCPLHMNSLKQFSFLTLTET